MRREQEERAKREAETESGRGRSASRSAALFDGVGRGRSPSAGSSREKIISAVGKPLRGIREPIGTEHRDPLRSYRVPESEDGEEVRRGSQERRRQKGESESEEEVEEEPKKGDDESALGRLATILESAMKRNRPKDEDLLHYGGGGDEDDGSVKFRGSRGLVAFEAWREGFKRNPGEALREVDDSAKVMLGVRPGAPYRLGDVLTRLPFKSFNTKRRAFGVLAEAAEALLQGKVELCKGIIAQGMRWLSLSLLILADEDASWKVTLLPDPIGLQCVEPPKKPDLQHAGLQSVYQVTALCGLLKDEEALGLRVIMAGKKPKGEGKGDKEKKDTG